MLSKIENIIVNIIVIAIVIVFSILLIVAFNVAVARVTYNLWYRNIVNQHIYKVLDVERVLETQHVHKGLPVGGEYE